MIISDKWFYQNPPLLVKIFLLTFIWGDAIVLFPLLIFILSVSFFNLKLGLILYSVLICLRYFIEIFYWLLQQFGPKTYRPHDLGLKQLSNNSIYIIYQLFSMALVFISTSALILFLTKN